MKDFLLNLNLESGHIRGYCPVCNAPEKSLVVTMEGRKVKWICHRASCNNQGSTLVRSFAGKQHSSFQQTDEYDTSQPFETLQNRHSAKPVLKGQEVREVKDETGALRGTVLRATAELRKANPNVPKDINRIEKGWVMLHFPSPLRSKSVIIVEDIPSANKMDRYFPCVCLLGTHLNEYKLEYLLNLGINHVIIALDNDATRKSIQISRKYMVKTSILPLQKDLKDQTDEDLKDIARRLNE